MRYHYKSLKLYINYITKFNRNIAYHRSLNPSDFFLKTRAYFKECLQLQRTEKFQSSKHFQISCQKKFRFPTFPTTFFTHLTKISISSTKNSNDLFLVRSE